ncbi:hypothetical protein [Nannocystis pusilla]|uniref:hypothetical protein n=1 Tax=Nannocystis pusilla TaxID=889268 RepID=UPI003B77A60D
MRIDFQLAPDQRWVETIVVDAAPIRTDGASVTKVDVERMRKIPIGGTSRDYTAVVDIAPLAGKDAGGIRIASATSAESKYVVDSQNSTSPAFGTVGASIVQEFVDEVEVVEGVFDAENGGASGGLVRARRIGGTNKLRGVALFRFTPRIAQPRFIDATDESLRVAEIYNYEMQGVVTLSGPIVRDKLFFAVGVARAAATTRWCSRSTAGATRTSRAATRPARTPTASTTARPTATTSTPSSSPSRSSAPAASTSAGRPASTGR